MATRRALIIGGSVGGLFAAHMLGRIGWEVDVFERAREDLAGRGAGIGTHPALGEVMRQLGLAVDESLCVATGSYVCWDNADRLIHEVRQQRMMSAWFSSQPRCVSGSFLRLTYGFRWDAGGWFQNSPSKDERCRRGSQGARARHSERGGAPGSFGQPSFPKALDQQLRV